MKKILGIGNALVDVLVNIDNDEILSANGLDKGGMVMIDADRKRELHKGIAQMKQVCATGWPVWVLPPAILARWATTRWATFSAKRWSTSA